MAKQLSAKSTEYLQSLAMEIRAATTGQVVTYSPKAFFPLTTLCRDSCGYCTFAQPPARVKEPYMSREAVASLARRAAAAGASEALFTLGERPELRYRIAAEALRSMGHESTVSYLAEAAEIATSHGLLPHLNAGTLTAGEVAALSPHGVSMGIMLESISNGLECHRLAPDKAPAARLATLEAAGALGVPMTTGLLVGIGDTEEERVLALEEIASIHARYHNIQEVIVQNLLPKPGTPMARVEAPSAEIFHRTIALARIVLPPSIHLQAPPNLSDDLSGLLASGIDDLGGVSRITIDHVNPERPWPQIAELEAALARLGFDLVPRLPVYPGYADRIHEALAPEPRKLLLALRDREGYAREHLWFSGQAATLPEDLFSPANRVKRPGWLDEIATATRAVEPVPAEHLELALAARGSAAHEVIELADALRATVNGDEVTYVNNRNINYTNVCTFKCRFCAFSKGPNSLNLRGAPYLLDLPAILAKVEEAEAVGATEVCLQGGIHPNFDGKYYLELTEAIHKRFPRIHIHAFSALEVFTGAKRMGMKLEAYLQELMARGLRSLPGTAAEILADRVRSIICPDKLTTAEWLEVHETAHRVGLRSNVTIMFGTVETAFETARHLELTRSLQLRTGGFTEFVPLPFVHMGAPLYTRGLSRRGPTLREAILLHSVGRIAYHGTIPNIQASWVKMGIEGATALLRAGANDLGGTLMEESISHAAGAEHPHALETESLAAIAKSAGRSLRQRTTLYQRVPEAALPGAIA